MAVIYDEQGQGISIAPELIQNQPMSIAPQLQNNTNTLMSNAGFVPSSGGSSSSGNNAMANAGFVSSGSSSSNNANKLMTNAGFVSSNKPPNFGMSIDPRIQAAKDIFRPQPRQEMSVGPGMSIAPELRARDAPKASLIQPMQMRDMLSLIDRQSSGPSDMTFSGSSLVIPVTKIPDLTTIGRLNALGISTEKNQKKIKTTGKFGETVYVPIEKESLKTAEELNYDLLKKAQDIEANPYIGISEEQYKKNQEKINKLDEEYHALESNEFDINKINKQTEISSTMLELQKYRPYTEEEKTVLNYQTNSPTFQEKKDNLLLSDKEINNINMEKLAKSLRIETDIVSKYDDELFDFLSIKQENNIQRKIKDTSAINAYITDTKLTPSVAISSTNAMLLRKETSENERKVIPQLNKVGKNTYLYNEGAVLSEIRTRPSQDIMKKAIYPEIYGKEIGPKVTGSLEQTDRSLWGSLGRGFGWASTPDIMANYETNIIRNNKAGNFITVKDENAYKEYSVLNNELKNYTDEVNALKQDYIKKGGDKLDTDFDTYKQQFDKLNTGGAWDDIKNILKNQSDLTAQYNSGKITYEEYDALWNKNQNILESNSELLTSYENLYDVSKKREELSPEYFKKNNDAVELFNKSDALYKKLLSEGKISEGIRGMGSISGARQQDIDERFVTAQALSFGFFDAGEEKRASTQAKLFADAITLSENFLIGGLVGKAISGGGKIGSWTAKGISSKPVRWLSEGWTGEIFDITQAGLRQREEISQSWKEGNYAKAIGYGLYGYGYEKVGDYLTGRGFISGIGGQQNIGMTLGGYKDKTKLGRLFVIKNPSDVEFQAFKPDTWTWKGFSQKTGIDFSGTSKFPYLPATKTNVKLYEDLIEVDASTQSPIDFKGQKFGDLEGVERYHYEFDPITGKPTNSPYARAFRNLPKPDINTPEGKAWFKANSGPMQWRTVKGANVDATSTRTKAPRTQKTETQKYPLQKYPIADTQKGLRQDVRVDPEAAAKLIKIFKAERPLFKTDRQGRIEKIERYPEKTTIQEKMEKIEKAQKAEKAEKAEKVEKLEKGVKAIEFLPFLPLGAGAMGFGAQTRGGGAGGRYSRTSIKTNPLLDLGAQFRQKMQVKSKNPWMVL